MSDDDEDFEVSDSDEDDLNPSKISEYDEDRAERESVISSQTGCSSRGQKLTCESLVRSAGAEDARTSSQVSVCQNGEPGKGSDYENSSDRPVTGNLDLFFLDDSVTNSVSLNSDNIDKIFIYNGSASHCFFIILHKFM